MLSKRINDLSFWLSHCALLLQENFSAMSAQEIVYFVHSNNFDHVPHKSVVETPYSCIVTCLLYF